MKQGGEKWLDVMWRKKRGGEGERERYGIKGTHPCLSSVRSSNAPTTTAFPRSLTKTVLSCEAAR